VASATVPEDYPDEDIPGLIWGLAQGNHRLALRAIRLDRLPRGADQGTIVEWDFAFTHSGPSGFVPARRWLSVKQLGRVRTGPELARTLLVPLEAVDDLAELHREQYEVGVWQYSVFGLETDRSSELTRELARSVPRHRRRFRLWKAIAPNLSDILRGNDRFVSFHHEDPEEAWDFNRRLAMVAAPLSRDARP
jgi:hypothetical protein